MRRKKLIFFAPLAMVAFALFVAAGGAIVMYLWNWLLPPLFGWRIITLWQALAMLVLCRILFGGFGKGGMHPGMRRRMRERMSEKWDRMTPEERERFRHGIRETFGQCPGGTPAAGNPGGGS